MTHEIKDGKLEVTHIVKKVYTKEELLQSKSMIEKNIERLTSKLEEINLQLTEFE